jgi:glycerol-3-phosphate acyltransferase PlsY
MNIVIGAAAAYLAGCVPVAQFVERKTRGKPWGPLAETVAGVLKGFAVLALINPTHAIQQALVLTALVSGDQWPIHDRANGRLGLAAAGGGMTAITPIAPVIWGLLWGLGFVATGYRTVGRVVALLTFWAVMGFIAGWPVGLVSVPVSVMILAKSNDDIGHLRAGRESKHHWNSAA